MKYDFSKVNNRFNTNSLKWDVKKNELPMWVADMDFKTAPEVINVLKKKVDFGIFGYTILSEEYYNAIRIWWSKRHNFNINKEWILFCTGVVPAISSIVRKITNKGDNIVILSPVYNIFYNSILNNDRNVLSSSLCLKVNEYYIDFDDLENKLSKKETTLMIICNPHNPIGKVWDRETLKKIGQLCLKYNVIVLSDEIHCDLTFEKNYIPFASLSPEIAENSITCISPTKAFNLAGIQTSSIIIPNKDLRKKVNRAINTDEIAEPNIIAVEATIAAFTMGEPWLKELIAYLKDNKEFANRYIKENISEVKVIPSDATYLLWIDCSKIIDKGKDFCQFLRDNTGLYISEGEIYGGNSEKFIRMNIACPRITLEDGLLRLKKGIDEYKKIKKSVDLELTSTSSI